MFVFIHFHWLCLIIKKLYWLQASLECENKYSDDLRGRKSMQWPVDLWSCSLAWPLCIWRRRLVRKVWCGCCLTVPGSRWTPRPTCWWASWVPKLNSLPYVSFTVPSYREFLADFSSIFSTVFRKFSAFFSSDSPLFLKLLCQFASICRKVVWNIRQLLDMSWVGTAYLPFVFFQLVSPNSLAS